MLDKEEFQKYLKPFLTLLVSKTAFFLSIIIFLSASRQIGFSSDNSTISHCDSYLNFKISQYQNKIESSMFIMTLIGTLASGIDACLLTKFYIKTRKHQNSKLERQKRFSQNTLRFHFILTCVEAICLLNIFLRSIEQMKQSDCNSQSKSNYIVLILISALILFVLVANFVVLFRILSLIKRKVHALQEFNLYSDQETLKQNLFFNQNGYIKELFKQQNCITPSKSLKNQLVKNFPSGFRKFQSSSTREIVHRLLGGNKSSTSSGLIKNSKKYKKEEQVSLEQYQNNLSLQASNSKKKDNDKLSSSRSKNSKFDFLQVNQKSFKQSPNYQNLQSISTTLNVIQLSIRNQRQVLKSSKQIIPQANSPQQNPSQTFIDKSLFKIKKVPVDSTLNHNQKTIKTNDKLIPIEIKEEQQLKQRFNLTPNVETRKKYARTKNYQNIDHNDNYFIVDVDKIKKKTKFLKFSNIGNDHDNVDPNTLYSKGIWNPKQKRIGEMHQKCVQQYLNDLSKIRKQEMLYSQDQSSYSDSFQEDDLSSEMQNSSNQDQKDIDHNNLNSTNPQEQKETQQQKVKQQETQLYLYLKRKKNIRVQNKLKLYEDEDGFYDEEEQQFQSSQKNSQLLEQGEDAVQDSQIYDKTLLRRQSIEKTKVDEKIQLKNKQLQSQEARMLRFIRKKYIDPNQFKKQSKQKSHIVFANSEKNSLDQNVIQQPNQQKS